MIEHENTYAALLRSLLLNTAGKISRGSPAISLDGSDITCVARNALEGRGPKPKTERILAVYWDLHKERLQPLYKASGGRSIQDWNTFLTKEWAEESNDVKQAANVERNQRHSAAMEKWNSSGSKPLDIATQRR